MEETRIYDGQTLKEALKSAEELLETRIEEINALNVFPVPDGDTGINMYLTLQSATEAVKDLSTTSVAEISSKAAMGALLGARGNSGVILSQILRGLAKSLEMKDRFTASDFAQALRQASNTAYKSIANPVEGTILTVIREAAEEAAQQVKRGADMKKTLTAVTSRARDAVLRTPEMLPALKDAGVVDSGGKGLFYIFLGMKKLVCRKISSESESSKTLSRSARAAASAGVYGFDLQFLIEGQNLPVDELRNKVCSMGESVLVVGDESLVRVHVHTLIPQEVMDYCSARGCLKDIVKENLDSQVQSFKRKQNAAGLKKQDGSRSKPPAAVDARINDFAASSP